MFWRVSNEMEQRKELIGVYVFMRMETILSNFMRNWQSFTVSLVLQIVMWRKSNAKEPSTPEKNNYFSMITPASQSLVTVSYLDEQNVHVFTHAPYGPDYGLCDFFLFSGEEAETGRVDTWSVNICHFRAHDFPPDYIRRSWKSWQCIEKRE